MVVEERGKAVVGQSWRKFIDHKRAGINQWSCDGRTKLDLKILMITYDFEFVQVVPVRFV